MINAQQSKKKNLIEIHIFKYIDFWLMFLVWKLMYTDFYVYNISLYLFWSFKFIYFFYES